MSIEERREQIKALQNKIADGGKIDLTEDFDELVDYLQENGYDIVKREYPETTEERIEEYSKELLEEDSPRSAFEIEKGVKDLARRAKVDQENVMFVWESGLREVVRRAMKSGRTSDFAEAIEYIKAGHSIKKQSNKNE